MATAAVLERERESEGDVRAFCERCIDKAWDAFDNHRPELGSRYIWDATDTALRNLGAMRGVSSLATWEEQMEFARLLDAKSGNGRQYYVGGVMMGDYFHNITKIGAEPGFDLTDFIGVAVNFVHHLLDLAEAAEVGE